MHHRETMMMNKECETIKKNIMKQNPYPSILHTAQKSAFRQRGIGGSLLRTALAVLLLASAAACSDDTSNDIPGDGNDDTGNAANLVTVRFASGTGDDATPEARTTIGNDGETVKWKTGDEIGISAVRTDGTGTNETNKKYNPATAEVNSTFTPADGGEEMRLAEGAYTFYSYYPWQDGNAADKVSNFELPEMRQDNGTSSNHIGKYDLMWDRKESIRISADGTPQVSFQYKHVFPMLVFKIEQAKGKQVKRISVRSADGTTPVRGKMNIPLANGKIEVDTYKRYYETSLTFTTPMTQDGTGRLLILPQEAGANLIIGLLTTDNSVYQYTKTASQGLEGGKSYEFTFNLTEEASNREVYTAAGTNTNWQIADESGLRAFALAVNYYGQAQANAILTDNVTLSTYAAWKDPIGIDMNYPYKGTFNGGGYTISGLNINRTSGDNVGLFGYLVGATVQNLRVTGSVTAEDSKYVGGIAGNNYGTIENCLFAGDVKGDKSVGGIAGNNKSRITACFSSGSVVAQSSRSGGIAGRNDTNATIKNCYSSATVTATLSHAGGIIGENLRGNTVSSCYATETVSATNNYAGGIAGSNGTNTTIKNCLALGSAVTRTSGEGINFGRVVGENTNGNISGCAAWIDMTLPDNVTATDNGDGKDGAPLTTADCKKITTYTSRDFDFDTPVWEFDATGAYLPWIKAFKSFSGINEADYRIATNHLKTAQ